MRQRRQLLARDGDGCRNLQALDSAEHAMQLVAIEITDQRAAD